MRYTAKTQPDFVLDDAFKARLRKIAAHIVLNRTDLATYESQKVVRDFGTHVTTSVDMGAALVQVIVIIIIIIIIFNSVKRRKQNLACLTCGQSGARTHTSHSGEMIE